MSWKSLVTAGLLCVLASPAFAVPTMAVVPGGNNASNRLNADGNWVWRVQITPTGTNSPLAAELGFNETAAAELLSASKNATAWDTDNPGTKIFGWEAEVDVDPGAATNMRPVGLQVSTANDQVFSALGSTDNISGATNYIDVVVQGPATGAGRSLTSTLQWLGKYGTGSVNGRIAEISGATAVNTDTFAGSVSFTALSGDTNLDGHRNGLDVTPFLLGFQAGTGKWFNGDYTGDGNVNGLDTTELLLGLQAGPPGSGSGSSVGAVPEPASLMLIALGMLAFIGRRVRK